MTAARNINFADPNGQRISEHFKCVWVPSKASGRDGFGPHSFLPSVSSVVILAFKLKSVVARSLLPVHRFVVSSAICGVGLGSWIRRISSTLRILLATRCLALRAKRQLGVERSNVHRLRILKGGGTAIIHRGRQSLPEPPIPLWTQTHHDTLYTY